MANRDDTPAQRKPPPPPLTTLGRRISSRPPPPPGEDQDSVPYKALLADLAAAEVQEFSDPNMQIRGKSLPARVSFRAKRAAGSLLEEWSERALAALRRLGEAALAWARERAIRILGILRTALPKAKEIALKKRREIAFVVLSVAALLLAADLAVTYTPLALRAAAAKGRVVTSSLIAFGAELHELVAGPPPKPEPAPPPPPRKPSRYVLEVVSVPPGATVTLDGHRFRTPGEVEITKPEAPFKVRVQKWGHAAATRSVDPDAFETAKDVMRFTLVVDLGTASGASARAKVATSAEGASAPGSAPAPALPPDREALPDRTLPDRVPLSDRAPSREPTAVPTEPF